MTTSTPSTPGQIAQSPGVDQGYTTVHTSFDSYPGIVHMTPDVSEDLGLETKLADRLAIWTA